MQLEIEDLLLFENTKDALAKFKTKHKDWISIVGVFIKHSWKMHNYGKVIENIIISCEKDLQ